MTYTARLVADEYYEMPESDIVTIGYCGRYTLGTKLCRLDELKAVEASDAIWLPVYAYVHSGQTISTTPFSCPWDSGQSGIAWISRKDAVSEWGEVCEKKAKACIQGFIEEFDRGLTGDVYGYVIENDGEEVESCWGFFGQGYAEEEMKAVLERFQAQKRAGLAFLEAAKGMTL